MQTITVTAISMNNPVYGQRFIMEISQCTFKISVVYGVYLTLGVHFTFCSQSHGVFNLHLTLTMRVVFLKVAKKWHPNSWGLTDPT